MIGRRLACPLLFPRTQAKAVFEAFNMIGSWAILWDFTTAVLAFVIKSDSICTHLHFGCSNGMQGVGSIVSSLEKYVFVSRMAASDKTSQLHVAQRTMTTQTHMQKASRHEEKRAKPEVKMGLGERV
eukprot:2735850-Amphidinium_carterae.1